MQFDDYIFREAQGSKELLALLQLRYQVYRNSRLKGFVPENEKGIDLDEYDPYSKHYGLFGVSGNVETPIGYVRVTEEERNPAFTLPNDVWTGFPYLCPTSPPKMPFSTMAYFPGGEDVYKRIKVNEVNSKVCETGRFSILEEFRTRYLSLFMIECLVAIYKYQEFTHALVSCSKRHAKVYNCFGFFQAPGTSQEKIENDDCPELSLLMQLLLKHRFSATRRFKIKSLGLQFAKSSFLQFSKYNDLQRTARGRLVAA